jgi:release factor glutamine methyltransferase
VTSPSLLPVVDRLRAAGCVFAEDEATLLAGAASSPAELESMVERRIVGLPLEQIVGWAEFCGLRLVVEPGVFVPRRRTEFLAERAIALARPGAVAVDLCCGVGAVAAALAAAVERVEVYAADIDPVAVRCARRNVAPDRVFEGDLYAPLPGGLRGRVEVLAVNAPYVPTGEIRLMPPEARDHEHHVALDGGADGLDIQRRVAAGAPGWLAPGGHLLIETSERQAPRTVAAFERSGLVTWVASAEERGATVVIGRTQAHTRGHDERLGSG